MENIELEILVFKQGLRLYHITPLNNLENQMEEGREYMKDLPKDVKYTYDPSNPMYFGLSEIFTMYYDTWSRKTSQWKSAHLYAETTDTIKLLNVDKNKPDTIDRNIFETLKENGLDGYIGYDDPNSNWREIVINEPQKNVKFIHELIHDYQSIGSSYPAKHLDQQNLDNSIIGRFNTERFFIVKNGYRRSLKVKPEGSLFL